MINKELKKELIQKFGGNEKNTGDISAQIAILTSDIESLKEHFKNNPKDKHSFRGFIAKIEKRKTLLNYLRKNDLNKYQDTIQKLNIRK
ncbi:MAG: 30S ribosomal protein S15 [Mycoplasma sp.]|nr:30S ribosomal protein S15 [Mycoplasma sp.]